MTREQLLALLKDLGACKEAATWAKSTQGSPEDLWNACVQYPWLVYLSEWAGVEQSAHLDFSALIQAERQKRGVTVGKSPESISFPSLYRSVVPWAHIEPLLMGIEALSPKERDQKVKQWRKEILGEPS